MKKYFFLLLLSITTSIFGQSYMDQIVDESCDCLDHISKKLDKEAYTMQVGLCMMKASQPYKKQLKKDYNIDMDNIVKDAERLGEVIGVQLAFKCPEALLLASDKIDPNNEYLVDDTDLYGTITKVETDQFVVFTIKDENGKSAKYYWFTTIETSEDLQTMYDNIVGKWVSIVYKTADYFDPKIGEYRSYNVITELELDK